MHAVFLDAENVIVTEDFLNFFWISSTVFRFISFLFLSASILSFECKQPYLRKYT